jgi:hypothetical protein
VWKGGCGLGGRRCLGIALRRSIGDTYLHITVEKCEALPDFVPRTGERTGIHSVRGRGVTAEMCRYNMHEVSLSANHGYVSRPRDRDNS